MNLFNQLLASAIGLMLIIGSLLAFSWVTGWFDPGSMKTIAADLAYQVNVFGELSRINIPLVMMGATICFGLGVALLLLPFFKKGRPSHLYLINSDELGALKITSEAVISLASYICMAITSIEKVVCICGQTESGALQLTCKLAIKPSANIVAVGEECKAELKSQIEEKTGLSIATINLETSYSRDSSREPKRNLR
jgi:hypothetical protein